MKKAGNYRPSEVEESAHKLWKEKDSYRLTRENRAKGPIFSFLDGPPYTTGSVHVGTAWNKVLKDLFIRYKRMRGFNVRDQPGYDMHGLPIEVRVEQTIGTKNKGDIEEYGVEKFVETCKKFAIEFRDKQTEQFQNLGVWMDWDKPYQTVNRSFISSVWWTLGEAHKKQLLTRSNRVLPWCPRCETALAEAEIQYWDETDPSIYVIFPLEGSSNESIVIWTTTPWTIPGNISAAVHPEEMYSRVRPKGLDEQLIIMKSLVEEALPAMGFPEYEIEGEVKGSDLLGKKYKHPLLEHVPYHGDLEGEYVHAVVVSDTVAKENTGIVHIAPGHGPEDFEIGKEYNLPAYCPVDEKGHYNDEVGERYAGMEVHEGGKKILDDLQDSGLLLKEDSITHRFGHCWRCKTPIIYRTTEQWFLKVPEIKDKILLSNESVKWYPEWAGSSRQRDWITNARDWCISRQRYWGTPLPIWLCECGEMKVISGYEELRGASGFEDGIDPHRPWLDRLEFECPACSSKMKRVPDVMDVWFDSGACSWAQLEYPEKKGEMEKWWPVEWITEAHDQTRGWFYSQLVLGTIAFEKSPFKSVLMHGWALDQAGRPMSKSDGTAIDPMEVIRVSGVDALRFYLLSAGAPWDDVAFQPDGPGLANRNLNIFWNVYKFATLYMTIDAFDSQRHPMKLYMQDLKPMDRWILSRLERMKDAVTSAMDAYESHEAARELEKFITDDLSRWYVRLVRDRLWIEGENVEKLSAFSVLHKVLMDCMALMAPFAPHISEEMYQNLDGSLPTVHMSDWPSVDESLVDESIEQAMLYIQELVEKAAKARQDAQLNLRWPIKRIVLKADSDDVLDKLNSLKDILLDQLNAKELEVVPMGEEWEEMILAVIPNPNAIGKVYRQWSSKIAVLLKSRPAKAIKEGVDKGEYSIGIEGQLVKILPNMVSFSSALPPETASIEYSHGIAYLDFEMNEDLLSEGFSREIVRRIQQMRKDMNLDVEEYVRLEIDCSARLEDYLTEWKSYITYETRAKELRFGATPKGDYIVEWTIEDETVSIGITNLKIKDAVGDLSEIQGLTLIKAKALHDAGLTSQAALGSATDSQIMSVDEIEREDLMRIREYIRRPTGQPQPMPAQTAPKPPIEAKPGPPAEGETQPSVADIAKPVEEDKVKKMEKADPESVTLEKTFTYLVEEERPETSYKLYVKMLESGMNGLCVTRNYPAKIKARFNLKDTIVYWLSNVGRENTIRPKDLEKLSISLEQFLQKKEAIILLDGLEYLITNNNFITVLRLIQSLRDQVAINQSILLMAVNPSTLESHQLNLLEREVDTTIEG